MQGTSAGGATLRVRGEREGLPLEETLEVSLEFIHNPGCTPYASSGVSFSNLFWHGAMGLKKVPSSMLDEVLEEAYRALLG